jgi:MFS family permease
MTARIRWRLSLALFASLMAFYAGFHQSRDWNSASRFLLSYAIVQHGSLEITPFVARNGVLVANPLTWDLSSPDRRNYFCDKAPGQSVAGAAAFALLRALGAAKNHPTLQDGPLDAAKFSAWPTDRWVTWLTSGAASAGSAVLTWLLVLRWSGSAPAAMGAATALGLATPMLPYATLYYGHALAGFFLLLAIYFCAIVGDRRRARWLFAGAAGLASGLAVATEYTLAVFVVATAIVGMSYGVVKRRGALEAFAYAVGGLVAAALLGWYHFSVTGDPFSTAYRYEVRSDFAAVHGQVGGIPKFAPNPAAARELLVGPRRGLLSFAPTALAALLGLLVLGRRSPFAAWTVGLSSVSLVAAISGFPNWDGGLAVGPRFLVPLLPSLLALAGVWLAQPCGPVGRCWRGLWLVAAGFGGALNLLMTAAGARMPAEMGIAEYLGEAFADPQRAPTWADDVIESVSGRIVMDASVSMLAVSAALLAVGLLALASRADGRQSVNP